MMSDTDLYVWTLQWDVHALTSAHGAVFAALSVAALLLWRAALREPLAPVRRLRDFGVAGALLMAPAVLVFLPYRAVQSEVALNRSLGEASYFSPNLTSF